MCSSNESRPAASSAARYSRILRSHHQSRSRTCISPIAVAICSTLQTSSITTRAAKSLIDQFHHAFVVRLAPDGPEMLAANFHASQLSFAFIA